MPKWIRSLLKWNELVHLTDREVKIIHLMAEGLTAYEMADRLNLGYETVRRTIQRIYRKLNVSCKEEALRRARELGILDGSEGGGWHQDQEARPWLAIILAVSGALAAVLLAVYLARPLLDPCAEFADLTQRKWEDVSASWMVIPDTGVMVREANPTDYFGKVESETMTVDLSRCPILRIDVEEVGTEAGYSVQILDKRSDIAVDILTDNRPGDWTIDLTQAVRWQRPEIQPQIFTINIWVTGEGKSVTFAHLSMRAGR
jgi:DNA-binding CsgD family transcriptional regulator